MINYFNLLPPETIEFIFKKLNLNDLINLRIVDKRFRGICDQIKTKQLIVSDFSDRYSHSSFWFYTNYPIDYKIENSIEYSKFQNYAAILQLDKHLKRLFLDIDQFNFSILNEFKLLEQLDIRTDELIDNYKLILDHLKIVDFHLQGPEYSEYFDDSEFKLTFDTIKLFAIRFVSKCSSYSTILNYPDKILYFESNSNYDLEKFINLQYLKTNRCKLIDRIILSKLKNLKILDLSVDYFYGININSIEKIKFIVNEKEYLKRSDLDIYFDGVKLINENKINEYKLTSNQSELGYNRLEFQIKNYDLLKDNCERYFINYCDLIKLIKIIPSSFTSKFPFINMVKINDHIDEDQFIEFLNNLQYLTELEFINCELTKLFFDKLINSVYLNDLKRLTIKEEKDLEMNFDFILELKELIYFETNQIITYHIDLIYKLYKGNKNIKKFISKFDSKNYIKIDKWSIFDIRSYYLDDNSKEVDNFSIDRLNSLDDVISKLKS